MPQDISIVIAKGGEGISTGKAFSEIDRLGFAEEQTEHLLEMYNNQDYKKLCFNRFEQVTNIEEIKDIREKMLGYGAEAACLSGSGSAVFGLFRDKDRAGNCAEERRLFYVAVTRARDRLLISSCSHRRKMTSTVECEPSRFLDEIPKNLVEYHEPSKEVDAETAHELLQNMLKNMAKPRVPKI